MNNKKIFFKIFLNALFRVGTQYYISFKWSAWWVGQHSRDLTGDHGQPSPRLAPDVVIVLSASPRWTLHPHHQLVTAHLCFLTPSPVSPGAPAPSHPAPLKMLSESMSLFLFQLFVDFVPRIPHGSEIVWHLSFPDLLHSAHRCPGLPCCCRWWQSILF